MIRRIALVVLVYVLLMGACVSANPFVDNKDLIQFVMGIPAQYKDDDMYNQSWKATGAPMGDTVISPNNDSLVSLGDLAWEKDSNNKPIVGGNIVGGWITLEFTEPIKDDPKNPYGLDFIVFGNPLFQVNEYTGEVDPYTRWQEPAFVEISPDKDNWYLILPNILPLDLQKSDTGTSTTMLHGYAEYTPTVGLPQNQFFPDFAVTRTNEELYTVPDRPSVNGKPDTFLVDSVSGGGDAFDIADAVVQSSHGVPARDANNNYIYAHLSEFKFIRLTDARDDNVDPVFKELSAEIDAVADVRPAVTIGEAKKQDDGAYSVITEAVVTYANLVPTWDDFGGRVLYSGECFVESPDRSAAIKLNVNQAYMPVEVGDKVTVTGMLSKADNKYCITDAMYSITASHEDNDALKSLGIPIKYCSLDIAYGLYIRTWGKVTDPGDGHYCVITDGSYSARVICDELFTVINNSFVSVTGICDRELQGSNVVIKLNHSTDIKNAL